MAIEESRGRRIKQPDYTIPVRLSRLASSSSSVLAVTKTVPSSTSISPATARMRRQARPAHRLLSSRSSSVAGAWLACGLLASLQATGHCDTQAAAKTVAKAVAAAKPDLASQLAQIELQHFKSLAGHSSPPKFDAEAIHFPRKRPLPVRHEAEPDGMSQILRMHESAQHQLARPLNVQAQPSASSLSPASPAGKLAASMSILKNRHQQQQHQQPERLKRWRSISSVATKTAATGTKKMPNKMVTQVLSYITPLVGNKLTTSLKLRPFAGRSIDGEASGKSSSSLFLLASAMSQSEPTSGGGQVSSKRASSSKRSNKSYSEPTTLVDNHSSSSSSKRHFQQQQQQQSLTEESDEIKDLMADSSSLSSLIAPLSSMVSSSDDSSQKVSAPANQMSDDGKVVNHQPSKAVNEPSTTTTGETTGKRGHLASTSKKPTRASTWLRQSANQMAQNYFQNSFRDLITLSQLPILSSSSHHSTAPSVFEKKQATGGGQHQASSAETGSPSQTNNKRVKNRNKNLDEFRRRAIEEIYRYAYLLATGVKNKRDPLSALASNRPGLGATLANYNNNKLGSTNSNKKLSQRSINQLVVANQRQLLNLVRKLRSLLAGGPLSRARPRGVMWDMATDPSLAVTVFHLLERASVALPLGFMLMPIIQMIRNPLNGVNFGRLLPARASHRSVDYEELAKRLDVVDKILSRALRQTHRESFMG